MGTIHYAVIMDMLNLRDGKRQKERTHLTTWVLRFVLVGLLAVIITFLLAVDFGRVDSVGPQEVFESHLAALDARDSEMAAVYIMEECTVPDEVPDFNYRRSFQVDEVWINEDGDEAILGLIVPAGLPNIALLEKVNGKWLMAC